MSIYMKMDGINGNVTTENYQNWIQVEDVSFGGIQNSMNNIVGKSQDRISSRPSFGEITLIKKSDVSSIKLFEAAHSGKVISKVEIDYVSTGNPPTTYSKISLTNVLISHYSEKHQGDGTSLPTERVRLHYETIEKTYTPRDASNKVGSPASSGYNLPQAKQL